MTAMHEEIEATRPTTNQTIADCLGESEPAGQHVELPERKQNADDDHEGSRDLKVISAHASPGIDKPISGYICHGWPLSCDHATASALR